MSTLKTEHTPGPWEFFDDGRGTIIIEAPEIGFRIATMAVIDPEMQQIQVSNAKLMRSAPDLLAALSGIVENEHTCTCPDGQCDGKCWHSIARVAIARARTGEVAP